MAVTSRILLFGLGFLALIALLYVGTQHKQTAQDFIAEKRPLQGGRGPVVLPEDALLDSDVEDKLSTGYQPDSPSHQTSSHIDNIDAVLYVYFADEGEIGQRNLKFFLEHALHDKADFYFIINGAGQTPEIPKASNIHVVRRDDTCFELGSIGEVLQADDGSIMKKYHHFILTSASVRGPFFPGWSRLRKRACWSKAMLAPLRGNVKLVGLTANCDTTWGPKYLQSSMLATDKVGLEVILPALKCHDNAADAMRKTEHVLTQHIRDAGWDAVPLYSQLYTNGRKSNTEFWDNCKHGDVLRPEGYAGMDVHPFDTMFVELGHEKDNKWTNSMTKEGMAHLAEFTQLMDDSRFSSYEQC